jgi:hypothetical protein
LKLKSKIRLKTSQNIKKSHHKAANLFLCALYVVVLVNTIMLKERLSKI